MSTDLAALGPGVEDWSLGHKKNVPRAVKRFSTVKMVSIPWN